MEVCAHYCFLNHVAVSHFLSLMPSLFLISADSGFRTKHAGLPQGFSFVSFFVKWEFKRSYFWECCCSPWRPGPHKQVLVTEPLTWQLTSLKNRLSGCQYDTYICDTVWVIANLHMQIITWYGSYQGMSSNFVSNQELALKRAQCAHISKAEFQQPFKSTGKLLMLLVQLRAKLHITLSILLQFACLGFCSPAPK